MNEKQIVDELVEWVAKYIWVKQWSEEILAVKYWGELPIDTKEDFIKEAKQILSHPSIRVVVEENCRFCLNGRTYDGDCHLCFGRGKVERYIKPSDYLKEGEDGQSTFTLCV